VFNPAVLEVFAVIGMGRGHMMIHAHKGQALLEYALVITAIIVAIIAGMTSIKTGVTSAMTKAGTTISTSVDKLP
jgi:Flp pilus assembly pilin Flp